MRPADAAKRAAWTTMLATRPAPEVRAAGRTASVTVAETPPDRRVRAADNTRRTVVHERASLPRTAGAIRPRAHRHPASHGDAAGSLLRPPPEIPLSTPCPWPDEWSTIGWLRAVRRRQLLHPSP